MTVTYLCWLETAGEAASKAHACRRDQAAKMYGDVVIDQGATGTVCVRRFGDYRVHYYHVDRTRLRTVARLIVQSRAVP